MPKLAKALMHKEKTGQETTNVKAGTLPLNIYQTAAHPAGRMARFGTN